jgi:AraC-like DNA-binding protein
MYRQQKPGCSLLAQYVDCFWMSSVDDMSLQDALILPDAAMDIIFFLSDGRLSPYLCGTMRQARTVSLKPGDCYFGIRFHPAMAAVGLNMNVADLGDCLVDLPLSGSYAVLEDRLMTQADPFGVFIKWAQSYLQRRLYFDDARKDQAGAFQLVSATGVSHLAQTLGMSRKRFYREFMQLYGISPRLYANIRRLLFFQRLVQGTTTVDLSHIALEAGFFDQADMTRQIKKLTGRTPLQLVSHLYNT